MWDLERTSRVCTTHTNRQAGNLLRDCHTRPNTPRLMPRFVILKHSTEHAADPRPTHWDLMFEVDGRLRTWAVEVYPWDACKQFLAVELPRHRLDYLEYEGEVSGNRGLVRRCETGCYVLLNEARHEWRAELQGCQLAGLVELRRSDESTNWRSNGNDWSRTNEYVRRMSRRSGACQSSCADGAFDAIDIPLPPVEL